MKKFLKKIIVTASTLSPVIMFAQLDGTNVNSLLGSAMRLLTSTIIPLLVAGALAYTIYAVVVFISENEDTKAKEEKKQQIFWGIIGLFVIVSIWSLVAIVGSTFGILAGGALSPR